MFDLVNNFILKIFSDFEIKLLLSLLAIVEMLIFNFVFRESYCKCLVSCVQKLFAMYPQNDNYKSLVNFFKQDNRPKPLKLFNIVKRIPTLIIIICTLINLSIADIIIFIMKNYLLFCFILIIVACLPAFSGTFIDSYIELKKYKNKRDIDIHELKIEEIQKIVKYGDINEILDGEGRYFLYKDRIIFQLKCNLSGMLCSFSLLFYALKLSGFSEFIVNIKWNKILSLVLNIALFISLLQNNSEQHFDTNKEMNKYIDNPDNFKLDRLHIIFNGIHLVITISFCIIMGILILTYIITMKRNGSPVPFNCSYLSIMAAVILFLWYPSASKTAINLDSVCMGNWQLPPLLLVIVMWSFAVFNLQISIFEIIIFTIICLAIFCVWFVTKENVRKYNASSIYGIYAALIGLLIVVIFFVFWVIEIPLT